MHPNTAGSITQGVERVGVDIVALLMATAGICDHGAGDEVAGWLSLGTPHR